MPLGIKVNGKTVQTFPPKKKQPPKKGTVTKKGMKKKMDAFVSGKAKTPVKRKK